MKLLLFFLFFTWYLNLNAQIAVEKHQLAAKQYVQSIVGETIFKNHVIYFEPKKDKNVYASYNLHLSTKLGYYQTHHFAVIEDTDTLQILKIYTDSLAQVYSIDSEWYGYKKTLVGYKQYFQGEFKYSYSDAVKMISDSLKSEKINFELICNCKISMYDARYNPEVLEGNKGKIDSIAYCYEISDTEYEDYPESKWKKMKKIYQIDPNTGYIIIEMYQPYSMTR